MASALDPGQVILDRIAAREVERTNCVTPESVDRLEPAAAASRARDEYAKRAVWARDGDDGMTRLTAYLKSTDATQVSDMLTKMARNKPSEGRTIDRMRADAFVDQMLGRGHGSTKRRAVIGVVVTTTSPGHTDPPPPTTSTPCADDTAR